MDHQLILDQLAKAQLKSLNSLGYDAENLLLTLIKQNLKNQPNAFLISIYTDFKILKAHTLKQYPSNSGMYLKLTHGRASIDEVLSGWGCDGPWIGPLEWFHCTYLTDIGIGFRNGQQLTSMSQSIDYPTAIYLTKGLLYYDGVYYGDWELQYVEAKNNPNWRDKEAGLVPASLLEN